MIRPADPDIPGALTSADVDAHDDRTDDPTRAWTWPRLIVVTSAKAVLVALLGLAAWGAMPALLGWHPTTVSSGSMLPRLHVGDVAVSRPLGAKAPPLDSVLLFDDPDHPGRLRMHRFVRVDDGLLVTRGDANRDDDPTPVALSAVRGIGTLRVPWIALPIVWLREGRWPLLVASAAALVALVLAAGSGRDRGLPEAPDQIDGSTSDRVSPEVEDPPPQPQPR